MAAELTAEPAGTYGLTCRDHPSHNRTGLAQAHATNAVAKHNRDHHDTIEAQQAALVAIIAPLMAMPDCQPLTIANHLIEAGFYQAPF